MDLFTQLNYVLSYPKVSIKLNDILTDKEEVKSFNNYMVFKWMGFHISDDIILNMNILNRYVFSKAFYKNHYLFVLMCKITKSHPNERLNYIKNKKTDIKHPLEIIECFKNIHGKFLRQTVIAELIELTRKKYIHEFAKICCLSGLKYKDIIKHYPELKDILSDVKIDAKEKKKLLISDESEIKIEKSKRKASKANKEICDIL